MLSCVFLVQFLCGYSRVLVQFNFLLSSESGELSPSQVLLLRDFPGKILFCPPVVSASPHVSPWWPLQFPPSPGLSQLEPDQEPGGVLHALHDGHGHHTLHLPALAVQTDGGDLGSDRWHVSTSGSHLQQ